MAANNASPKSNAPPSSPPSSAPPPNSAAGGGKTPALSVSDVTVTEGGELSYTVSLSATSNKPITVDYATASGTAQTADYAARSGTLTFAPGTTSQIVEVSTADDTDDELNETVLLDISNPSGATIADGSGTGTINDNDEAAALPPPPPQQVGIRVTDATAFEGDVMRFEFLRDGVPTQEILFDVRMVPVTAVGMSDFISFTYYDYTVPAGSPVTDSYFLPVDILEDYLQEEPEEFRIEIFNVRGAAVTDSIGSGFIIDDDAAPTQSSGAILANDLAPLA